jgi:hypothetical protein
MSDEHAEALVATVLEALSSPEDLDLSGVFLIVNRNVEALTQILMEAEKNGRFDEASDLAGDIAEVYQAAAQQVPVEQQEILESIAQYWEAKAGAALLRAAANDADLKASAKSALGPLPSAGPSTQILGRSFGSSGRADKRIGKGFSRSDESQGEQKSVVKPKASDRRSGGSKS